MKRDAILRDAVRRDAALNPSLQTFGGWLSKNKALISVT